ncbi:precorrin-4 C11-methyltransferase [Desulfonatronum thiosulfatophilum]|uniref:Precorrin-4 C11-methyltransferase n=1 Tax=Desulfonatronum thiosulfatophilum TaxID=617002 RepID=A0A1G6BB41_9BACT|nr:precorrin-4 C(11)-methyltransferase [Desulfonatronum thiosulfatophilum]SDB17800.1 precorrin-4 C11-methyltransferase [Desulfonatronum thiosulfatophilum]
MTNHNPPLVHFVGAGPGDPELLTVKAQRLIREADLIIYAGSLVPRTMLDQAKSRARIHDSAGLTLKQTHGLIRDAVLSGEFVVRLHTGDPGLYGAVREQVRLLEAEGIDYAVVPGVTAAMAAAAATRISFTIPETCQTLILTRMGGLTPVPERERLRGLATHRAALAVYLSGPNHLEMARELLDGGYPSDTMIIAAHRVGWPEERIERLTLDKLAASEARTHWKRQTVFLVLPGQEQSTSSRLYAPEFEHGFRDAVDPATGE